MTKIHPTAIVAPGACIDDSAEIGPYCIIGENVEIATNVRLISHVVVDGITSLGQNTIVYPFTSLGHRPQDLKYNGESSRLVIGKYNQIRENVTMNPGTKGGGMLTLIGDNGLFMVGSHIAHDCIVGNNVIFANNVTLGGHVQIGDFVVLGGLSAIHQFVRIGKHAMVGGMSGVEKDIIPYTTVVGNRAHLSGINLIGLKRRGYSHEDIHALRNAYRLLFFSEGTMSDRISEVFTQFKNVLPVIEILDFINSDSSRTICKPA
ncbi:MAG: acyl-ACP--UDP-N-acetylglucosamine O-acyltransferase [Rhodospirillaceae bacterium]|jgi:UDP-N-acetylglucosamine acyltransferase|nr:acyl-ACP--UDP-N-acetylglucosamine O-acyltransferase [Rhodospirillaceae bacterium]